MEASRFGQSSKFRFGCNQYAYQRKAWSWQRFIIAPYDAQTASIFANLWREHDTELKSKIDKPGRTCLRADAMIVATAIAREADCIYSEDPWLKNFAGINIQVTPISQIPIQKDFLDQIDNTNNGPTNKFRS